MKKLFIILFLFFLGPSSYCQNWIYAGADAQDVEWYVKSTYIKKYKLGSSTEKIRLWIKIEFKEKKIENNGKPLTLKNAKELQLIIADCTDRKIKIVTTTTYNSEGMVIDNFNPNEFEQVWDDVVPDSIGDTVLNKICELFK